MDGGDALLSVQTRSNAAMAGKVMRSFGYFSQHLRIITYLHAHPPLLNTLTVSTKSTLNKTNHRKTNLGIGQSESYESMNSKANVSTMESRGIIHVIRTVRGLCQSVSPQNRLHSLVCCHVVKRLGAKTENLKMRTFVGREIINKRSRM